MNKLLVFAASGLLAVCGAAASASILVNEGMNYGLGSNLNGQGATSTGLAGTWSENNFGSVNDVTRDFLQAGMSFGSLTTSANSVAIRGKYPSVSRDLNGFTMGAAGTTRYVSFLLRKDSTGPDVDANFSDYGGLYVGKLFMGVVSPSGTGSDYQYVLEEVSVGNTVASGIPTSVGSTALLVTRIDFSSNISAGDTCTLYVNPTPGAAEPGTYSARKTDLNLGTFSDLGYVTGAYADWSLDEIRIGTTYADVTPVPEPAMGVLAVGLCGSLLAIQRGRRR